MLPNLEGQLKSFQIISLNPSNLNCVLTRDKAVQSILYRSRRVSGFSSLKGQEERRRRVVQITRSKSQKEERTEGTRSAGREVRSPQILDIPSQVRSAFILITGQKPEERIFRVSRPGLNIRAGRLAALQVTLRRKSIYHFLDRLVTEILPNLKTDLTKPKDPARKTGVIFPYRQSSSPSS